MAPQPRRVLAIPWRRAAFVALAVAPFVLVAFGARLLVTRIADRLACQMASLASLAPSREPEPVRAETQAVERVERSVVTPSPLGPRGGPARRASKPEPHPLRLPRLVLSEDRLERLTEKQLRAVGWTTVVDEQGRSAGVRLSGVGALGMGLADGDVVTSIDGRPTPTESDATAAGSAAWGSGARSVGATIVRGDQTIAVTVELPTRSRQ
jgi:hypothetical protein